VEHGILYLIHLILWLDHRTQRPLAQVIPHLDDLRRDPATYLAAESVVIEPFRRRALGVLLGLLLALGLWVLCIMALQLLFPVAPRVILRRRLLLGLALILPLTLLAGCVWLMFRWLRGGEMRLTRDGVELLYGNQTFYCPWSLFNKEGQVFIPDPSWFHLPVHPEAVPFVRLVRDDQVVASGLQIKTRPLEFKSSHQAIFRAFYAADAHELATLLLELGRKLGTKLPDGRYPDNSRANAVQESEPVAPVVREKDGWLLLRLTHLSLPSFCCECGCATKARQEFQGHSELVRLGGVNLEGGEFVTLAIPVCEECQAENRRVYWDHLRDGIFRGVIFPLAFGMGLSLLVASWIPLIFTLPFLLLGFLFGVVSGHYRGKRAASPVELERYQRGEGSVAARFREVTYTEALVELHTPADARTPPPPQGTRF
jgi:hypothetical protein